MVPALVQTEDFDSSLGGSSHSSPVRSVRSARSARLARLALSARSEGSGSEYEDSDPGDPDSALVQFIHQTTKSFMVASDGSAVVSENLLENRTESGHQLLFKYLVQLLTVGRRDGYELDIEALVLDNLTQHGREVEQMGYSIHDVLTLAISSLQKDEQDNAMRLLTTIVTAKSGSKYGGS
jgi:hypothetical protein